MHRCFVETSWIKSWYLDPTKAVPSEVKDRLLKIVRIKEGETVALFDGQGHELQGLLSTNGVFSLTAQVEIEPESVSIVLLQAAIEEVKMAETIKRGTEFGVGSFIIFKAERSDAFSYGKLEKRAPRLKSLAIDAARQSGRLFVPEISFVKNLASWKPEAKIFGIFGDLDAQQKLSTSLATHQPKDGTIAMVVGPEGGLSLGEKNILSGHGFKSVQWAPYTLRSEFASLSAVAIINGFLGRA